MVLRLVIKACTRIPLEVEGITPDQVRGLSATEIAGQEIFHGNEKVPLGDFFAISGDAGDGVMEWVGDLRGVHWIGAGMQTGRLHVLGSAGRHVGSEMRGGEILVEEEVGDWLGGEMHGGRIWVRGQAGHLVGAAYRGGTRGMTGGEIFVQGAAGNEVGSVMRRGLIAIGGRVGDLTGFNMRAGTVVVTGESGIRQGACMRRGTLLFLGAESPPVLPTFRYGCTCQPVVLSLLVRHLQRQAFPIPEARLRGGVRLYHGDLLEGGRGELLLPG